MSKGKFSQEIIRTIFSSTMSTGTIYFSQKIIETTLSLIVSIGTTYFYMKLKEQYILLGRVHE